MKPTIRSMAAAAGLATLLLAGCVETNKSLMAATDFLPDSGHKTALKGALDVTREWTAEEERQIGADMSAVLLGARPLVRNIAVERYLNQVGMWIALQSPKPDIAWRFGMIDSPDMNAFAAPGGYIFITRGLFLKMQDEAELAGVLSHEIGHVLQRHHLAAIRKRGAGQVAFGLLEARTAKRGGVVDMSAFNNVVRGLYTSGLDKGDEFEADRIGVALATRAGYAPGGLRSVLQMYAASANEDELGLLFATHPASSERVARVTQQTANGFDRFNNGATNAPRLKAIQRFVKY